MIWLQLKQHYVEPGILCALAPPTVSECNTTVVNTNPRSVTICQFVYVGANYK